DVALAYTETANRRWTVTICTADFLGALSLIVGLLTAYRLDVLRADILTFSFPSWRDVADSKRKAAPRHGAWLGDQPPARRLLDVFDVRALADPEPDLWHKFRDDLAGLFAADRAEDRSEERRVGKGWGGRWGGEGDGRGSGV